MNQVPDPGGAAFRKVASLEAYIIVGRKKGNNGYGGKKVLDSGAF